MTRITSAFGVAMLVNLRRVAVSAAIWTLASLAGMALAANVDYVYDENGRLVAIYAPSGDSANYVYDAGNNIVEIRRFTASQIAIFEFTPNAGPVGSSVTIHGSGFSATASNNAVTVNGVTATVTAATTRTLTITVPSGATTGLVAVTVSGSTATSATSFVVTSSGGGVPTISSFSPAGGTPGTSISVSGTNFETTAANNTVVFNNTYATPSASTSTSITVAVPTYASSGKIRVQTRLGTATSNSDFFVPFGAYAASDIVATGRVTIDGSSTAYSIGTAGKLAMVLFDGVQGQNLGIGITGITFLPSGGSATVYILRPDNLDLLVPVTVTATSNTTIDLPALPLSGTYTIAVVPGAAYRMDGTLTLSTDLKASLGSEGTVSTFSNTRAGQNGRYTFTATAAQKAAVYVYDISAGIQPLRVDLLGPTGTLVAGALSIATGAYIQVKTLDFAGTYTVLVSPGGTGTGTFKVQYGQPDLVVTGFSVGTVAVNQNGSYAIPFTAVLANQGTVGYKGVSYYDYTYLSVDGTLDTGDPYTGYINRNGTELLAGGSMTWNGVATTTTSTSTGSYTLFIKGDGHDVSGTYASSNGVLPESSETNNTSSAAVTLPTRPDLTVTAISAGTVVVNQNGSFTIPVTFTVKNNGASAAKANWWNQCYLSSDGTLDITDDATGYAQRTSDLAAGAEFNVTLNCATLTTKAPGTYTLFVKADGGDFGGKYSATQVVVETDETNNTHSASVTLPTRPDLIITNLTVGTVSANQNGAYTFIVDATVKNTGVSPAKPSWYTQCYLSSDGSLDTTDDAIGYHSRTTELAAGVDYVAALSCVTPTSTASGTYTLFAKADGRDVSGKYAATDSLVEDSETNNTSSASISLPQRADLTVSSFSVGTITVNPNGSYSIPVTFTVRNEGGLPAKANWYDECYLSTDSTLDTSDDFIGYQSRTLDLAASAEYTRNFTCVTPTTTSPGAYTLFVKADGRDASSKYSALHFLTESNENNNTASVSITLPTK